MPYANRFPTGSKEYEPADNARASLLSSITAVSLSIQLQNLASSDTYTNFPTGASGTEAPFIITVESEQILIYARSTDTLTVYDEDTHALGYLTAGQNGRGYAGTSAAAHTIPSGGSIVAYQYIVEEHIEQIQDAVSLNKAAIDSANTAIGLKAADNAVVHLTGNEEVGGVKTFTSFPVLPSSAPTTDYQAATKKYADDLIAGLQGERFGGSGADGAQGDADLTISGSNNTYIVKNFTTWEAGSVARTCTVTPTGCVVHLKIAGDADFTNWLFDFAGKGFPGGAAGAINGNGGAGTDEDIVVQGSTAGAGGLKGATSSGGGGGGGGGSYKNSGANGANGAPVGDGGDGGDGGAKSGITLLSGVMCQRSIMVSPGAGGGGGGGVADPGGVVGGAGGAGGGCLIIEVKGNVVFSSTTINANGINGSAGGYAGGYYAGGGGGGGGGGGMILIIYNGTATSAPTTNITAGSGGAGPEYGGAGGAGGAGEYALLQNTVF